MRRLVVTADDFGAAAEVNEAVEIGHRGGILTAASLMVTGAAAADAVSRANAMPSLRVGLHLVLVDGRPTLPAAEATRLVGADGSFDDNMALAGARMFFDPRARRQLAREIDAQFAAFAATGLALDHVNAHKHFHLHPTIAALIVAVGARHGLAAARVPLEPRSVVSQVEATPRHPLDPILQAYGRSARRRFRRAGLLAPDQVFGLRWSGGMTTARLVGLLESLPDGLSEIYLHPATRNDFDGAAPGYLYAEELAALVAPEAAAILDRRGIRRGGFADFAAADRDVGP